MGLDKPVYVQFVVYLLDVVTGDLGRANLTSRPVLEDLQRVFPATLELATSALVLGLAFGIPAGVMSAVHRGRWIDHTIRIIGLIGYSVPIFWLGLVALMIFYGNLGWVSGPGRIGLAYEGVVTPVTGLLFVDSAFGGQWDAFRNALSHAVLPVTLLGYWSLAYIARMTRNFMLEELSQEYITTARVKGVSEYAVIWRHAFGSIHVRIVTMAALSYAMLLEGAVLIETVFAWPGIGLYLTTSLLGADMNAVLGCTLMIGTSFILLNFLCDVLYAVLDPRAK